ncbi:BA14K family protein [Agrobacterium sp. 22094]|uniref:BA14K family protein n=1 Tax=Agrobacterium sp. 22094 TaxID=3453872 RepID=UPI003F845F11
MLNLRKTSLATALVMVLTSFTPSQAFQVPTPIPAPVAGQNQVVDIQYRDWRDRREWRQRHGRDWRNHREYRRQGFYNGHRGYRDRRPGYRYHNGYWFPLAAFAAGAIIGGATNQARPSYGSNHQQWCANRWRSYRAYDNSYQPNNGPRRQCVSPYS